jgi:hypothetical protein
LASGLDIVRKTLGRHEIAIVQTTAVDQPGGTINLTTLLAHTSGEWISSEWPVCPVTDTNAPRRMGAALTYARRYALFTLVGIAGEDDLDAPDLNDGTASHKDPDIQSEVKGNQSPSTMGPDHGTNRPTSRNRTPAKYAAKVVLDAVPSGALRDQLLTEVASLNSVEGLAPWARSILPAKNRLTSADAKLVEDAFAAKMISIEKANEVAPVPAVSNHNPIVAGVVSEEEAPNRVDKSVLTFGEPRRHRNKAHLGYVASHPCLICGRRPADAHHLRFAQPRTLGRKVSDEFTVPLCRTHHREAHHIGNERAWWESAGIDPINVAQKFWRETRGCALPSGAQEASKGR